VDTADALVETVQSLWPEATATASRSGGERDSLAELAVVPHLRAPRLLVPAHDARAAARALWRFNAATSVRETWGRTALAAAVRVAGLAPFRDRIRLHGRADGSLAEHLSELFGETVTFSLGIGTARVNRKPVLQLFGEHGRSVGFAKIGNSTQARIDVRAEAESLATLAGRSWRTMSTPELLHHGTWAGMEVLVMSTLPTSPWHRPDHQWRLPHASMAELAEAFAEEPRTLAALPWFERQRAIAGGLADPHLAEQYAAAVDAVLDRAGDRVWEVGAWHGDWTPWNMARHAHRVQLWDWERFEPGVPRGLDPFHYCVNAVTRRDGTSPATIIRGLELAGAARPERDTRTHHLAGLYLLAAAGRYLPLTAAEAGHHIADRARCTLDALHEWTSGEARTSGS
jgi:hypothetical protein